MRAIFLLVNLEPLFVVPGVASVAAVLAPNDQTLAQSALADHAKEIALAVTLGNRSLA